MRVLIAASAALIVFAQAAHAQMPSPPPAPSEKQKAAEAEKRARVKDIDEAYDKTIKRMPDVKAPAADPWGNLRATPSGK